MKKGLTVKNQGLMLLFGVALSGALASSALADTQLPSSLSGAAGSVTNNSQNVENTSVPSALLSNPINKNNNSAVDSSVSNIKKSTPVINNVNPFSGENTSKPVDKTAIKVVPTKVTATPKLPVNDTTAKAPTVASHNFNSQPAPVNGMTEAPVSNSGVKTNNPQNNLHQMQIAEMNQVNNERGNAGRAMQTNTPSKPAQISDVNPFTGNDSIISTLVQNYELWKAKNKVVSTMVDYAKNVQKLNELKAQSQNLYENSGTNAANSPAIQAKFQSLEARINDLENKVQSERVAQKIIDKKSKLAEKKLYLEAVIKNGDEYTALIKQNKQVESYNLNDQIGGNTIDNITPNSVTLSNGKVLSIKPTFGSLQDVAWHGYPRKYGANAEDGQSANLGNKSPIMETLPQYPHIRPMNLPNNALPSMSQ